MSAELLDLMWFPFLMCLVLTGIHAYLGVHVLAREVVFVADGAPWIWARLDWVVAQVGLNPLRVVEVLDWCHGAHHVSVALEALTRLSDPYATAAILWSRVSMTSGEGASVPEGPKTSYCHICNRNAPNMSVNVGVTL
mgnify:CR=1 FL=1